MVCHLGIRTDENKLQMEAYNRKLDDMSPMKLLKEFFTYLDYEEESDSGRVFRPITISSCRVMMSEPLNEVINRLRGLTYE